MPLAFAATLLVAYIFAAAVVIIGLPWPVALLLPPRLPRPDFTRRYPRHKREHDIHHVPSRREEDAGHQVALLGDDHQESEEVLHL